MSIKKLRRNLYTRLDALDAVSLNANTLTDEDIRYISMAMAINSTKTTMFKMWSRSSYLAKIYDVNREFLSKESIDKCIFNNMYINSMILYRFGIEVFHVEMRTRMKYKYENIFEYANKALIYIDSRINPMFVRSHCLNVSLFRLLIGNNSKSDYVIRLLIDFELFINKLFNYFNFNNIYRNLRSEKDTLDALINVNYIIDPIFIIHAYYDIYYAYILNNYLRNDCYIKGSTIKMCNDLISNYFDDNPLDKKFQNIIDKVAIDMYPFNISLDKIYHIMNNENKSKLLTMYEENYADIVFPIHNDYMISCSNDMFNECMYSYAILKIGDDDFLDTITNPAHIYHNPYLPNDISFDNNADMFKKQICNILYHHTRNYYSETVDDYINIIFNNIDKYNKNVVNHGNTLSINFDNNSINKDQKKNDVENNHSLNDNNKERMSIETENGIEKDIRKEYYIYSPFITTLDLIQTDCKVNLILSTKKPQVYPILTKIEFYYSSKNNKVYNNNSDILKSLDIDSINQIYKHLLESYESDLTINVYYKKVVIM